MFSHTERRHLPYTPAQLFDLVADVEKYPEFIGWFVSARIRNRHGNVLEVDQTVRFAGLRAAFTSRAVLDPLRRILISTTDFRFRTFEQRWSFARVGHSDTLVEYDVALELSFGLPEGLVRMAFDERETAAATVGAFELRAQRIYGGQGRTEPPHP